MLFNKNQTSLITYPGDKDGNYTIPNSVTSIEVAAFDGCTDLTSVTIPDSMTLIGEIAFGGCLGLRSVYFLGDAPAVVINPTFHQPPFVGNDWATIFYRVGKVGWGSQFGWRPTALWLATDDLDKDGTSNLEEMVAGTDPLDATSLLAFEGARPEEQVEADRTAIPAGQHALYFQSNPGMRYEILASESLGGEWTSVAMVSATAFQKRALVDKPVGAAFYRVRVLPQP